MMMPSLILAAALMTDPAVPDRDNRSARVLEGCAMTSVEILAEARIARTHIEATACDPAAPRAALRFDRQSGTLRAAEALPAGTYLGRLDLGDASGFDAGTALILDDIAFKVQSGSYI